MFLNPFPVFFWMIRHSHKTWKWFPLSIPQSLNMHHQCPDVAFQWVEQMCLVLIHSSAAERRFTAISSSALWEKSLMSVKYCLKWCRNCIKWLMQLVFMDLIILSCCFQISSNEAQTLNLTPWIKWPNFISLKCIFVWLNYLSMSDLPLKSEVFTLWQRYTHAFIFYEKGAGGEAGEERAARPDIPSARPPSECSVPSFIFWRDGIGQCVRESGRGTPSSSAECHPVPAWILTISPNSWYSAQIMSFSKQVEVPVTAAGSPPEETSSHSTLGFRCFWLKLIFGEFSWRVIPFWFGLYVPSAISRPLLLESHGFMLSFTVWLFSSGLCSFIVIFTRLWGCFRPWFQDTENVGYSIWIAAALVVLTGCSTVWGPTPESFCSLRSRIVRFDLTPRGLSVEALIFFPPFTCF